MAVYKLFEVFGIELEYMIVDKQSGDVKPIADQLIEKVAGQVTNEVNNPLIDWSNELVNHVVEFKNNRPYQSLVEMMPLFQEQVNRANEDLAGFGAQLLPGAMHPWMNSDRETKLWPHGNNEIYSAYDRIFSCKGHGWSNLQSLHINLPFSGDEEFRKLHSAIRVILPLIPALSSSSPIVEGEHHDCMSNRLRHYLQNQRRIPTIIGKAIPDVSKSEADYFEKVLQPMYRDIAPFDTDGILQEEWLNSRGAIPKFERHCIEIRLCDVQEAPAVDLAIADFWVKLIQMISEDKLGSLDDWDQVSTDSLRGLLNETVFKAESALVSDADYLRGFAVNSPLPAQDLLLHLLEKLPYHDPDQIFKNTISRILQKGSLSQRMLNHLNGNFSKDSLRELCHNLSLCLSRGELFEN